MMSFAKIKIIPLHPFLFGVYPLLFFYSKNQWLFPLKEFITALGGIIIVFAVFLFAVGLILRRNFARSGIFISFAVLMFFSAGPAIPRIDRLLDDYIPLRGVLLLWGLIFIIGTFIIARFLKNCEKVTTILNIIALFLIALPLLNISKYEYRSFVSDGRSLQESVGPENSAANYPDIYYIILDGYASAQTLKEQFGYDNSEFYGWLKQNGFYVVPGSFSNYTSTKFSLASSLNMRYLSEEDGVSQNAIDDSRVLGLIQDNEVRSVLADKGYSSVYIGTGFFREKTPIADVQFSWNMPSNFLLSNTLFFSFWHAFAPPVLSNAVPEYTIGDGQGVLRAFDNLMQVPKFSLKKPVFTFAHILAPHNAFTLDSECNIVDPPLRGDEGYIKKLECTNKKIKEAISGILANSPREPVIILASDHGESGNYEFNQPIQDMEIANIPDAVMVNKIKNFTAFYLPGIAEEKIPNRLSSVNTFRLIFNLYFNAVYDFYDDRYYFFCDAIGGCRDGFMFDITERVGQQYLDGTKK